MIKEILTHTLLEAAPPLTFSSCGAMLPVCQSLSLEPQGLHHPNLLLHPQPPIVLRSVDRVPQIISYFYYPGSEPNFLSLWIVEIVS